MTWPEVFAAVGIALAVSAFGIVAVVAGTLYAIVRRLDR